MTLEEGQPDLVEPFEHLLQKLSCVFSEQQVEQVGRETGFTQRRSKIKALDFLKLTLFDHFGFGSPSLQQHACNIHKDNGKKISKQAIDKRFGEKGVLLLQGVFERLFNQRLVPASLPSGLCRHFRSVRIMDSTRLRLPACFAAGAAGTACKSACGIIQFEYDILRKKIECLSLESTASSDRTFAGDRMHNVCKGDLLLRDLGYYSIDTYLKIEQQQAFYISRIRSQVKIFRRKAGCYQPLSWAEIRNGIMRGQKNCFDEWVYIGEKQKHPVRMLAWLSYLSGQPARDLHDPCCKTGTETRELHVVISNVPSDRLNAEQIARLYKARWQIELVFKAWKRVLNIECIRKMKADRLKCYLLSKLVWILVSWDVAALAGQMMWQQEKKLLSLYKATAVLKASFMELKQALFSGKTTAGSLAQVGPGRNAPVLPEGIAEWQAHGRTAIVAAIAPVANAPFLCGFV